MTTPSHDAAFPWQEGWLPAARVLRTRTPAETAARAVELVARLGELLPFAAPASDPAQLEIWAEPEAMEVRLLAPAAGHARP